MVEKIIVAIERKFTHYVEVEADSPTAAKAQVMQYGAVEAWSDFSSIRDDETVRVFLPKTCIVK